MIDETIMRIRLGVSPASAKLLNQMLDREYLAQKDTDMSETGLAVEMHRLRSRLEERSITVQSRRGVGYWLTPDDKAMVAQLCATQEATNGDL